jgi:hypothetical protein
MLHANLLSNLAYPKHRNTGYVSALTGFVLTLSCLAVPLALSAQAGPPDAARIEALQKSWMLCRTRWPNSRANCGR